MKHVAYVIVALFAPAALAQAPAAAPVPKPALRKAEASSASIGYRLKMRPGVGEPGTTVMVEIELAQLLTESDPTFGKRKPIDDADLRVILVAPPAKKGGKTPAWIAAHEAVRLADSGTYGVTFTPPTAGIYGLYLRGDTKDAGALDQGFVFPVGIWPVADDAPFPALPSPEPAATAGNFAHGKAVCAERCKQDHEAALPKNAVPSYLRSDVAEALSDDELLSTFLNDTSLDPMERADVLYYLRGLHTSVRELFPKAAAVLAHSFTINQYGKERLAEHKLKLTDEEATATVFTVFGGEAGEQPVRVGYNDRVERDRLTKGGKLGYVVFLSLPKEKNAYELAIAVGVEPNYPVVKMIGRAQTGARDASLNKLLGSFAGLGKFNDPKSLLRGPAGLREQVLPVYLRAAELATMYYADEREFTAFDAEFAAPAAEAVPTVQPTVKKSRR